MDHVCEREQGQRRLCILVSRSAYSTHPSGSMASSNLTLRCKQRDDAQEVSKSIEQIEQLSASCRRQTKQVSLGTVGHNQLTPLWGNGARMEIAPDLMYVYRVWSRRTNNNFRKVSLCQNCRRRSQADYAHVSSVSMYLPSTLLKVSLTWSAKSPSSAHKCSNRVRRGLALT